MMGLNRRAVVCGIALLTASLPHATMRQVRAAEAISLAINGYDPVAYFTIGKPTRGLAEFEYVWDEHRYRFLNERHRAMFMTEPLRYAPQFANFCAMALTRGELIEADPENWLVNDDKLYVFGKPIGPGLFSADYAGNLEKATGNRALIRPR